MKRVSILKRSAMVVMPLSFLVGCVAAVPALLGAGAVGGTAAATEMDETEIKILAETENYFGAKHGEIKISEYQDRTVAITYGGLKSEVQRTEERGQDDKQDKLSAVE